MVHSVWLGARLIQGWAPTYNLFHVPDDSGFIASVDIQGRNNFLQKIPMFGPFLRLIRFAEHRSDSDNTHNRLWVAEGNIEQVIPLLRNEWTSLPGAKQSKMTMETVKQKFAEFQKLVGT